MQWSEKDKLWFRRAYVGYKYTTCFLKCTIQESFDFDEIANYDD